MWQVEQCTHDKSFSDNIRLFFLCGCNDMVFVCSGSSSFFTNHKYTSSVHIVDIVGIHFYFAGNKSVFVVELLVMATFSVDELLFVCVGTN